MQPENLAIRELILEAQAVKMVTEFTSDADFTKFIYANKYVLVVFMEKDTENEANMLELTKKFKQVKFLQDKNEKDKLATGLSYQQLNGSGVTTEKLGDQISIVFRI